MTDLEKLKEVIETCPGKSFEDAVFEYLRRYDHDFTLSRIHNIARTLDIWVKIRIEQHEHAARVSTERATYLKNYLSGKMFSDEQTAKDNVHNQITHASYIEDLNRRVLRWDVEDDAIKNTVKKPDKNEGQNKAQNKAQDE